MTAVTTQGRPAGATGRPTGLHPGISVYLNAVRFLAALVVFFAHVSGHRFTDGFLWQTGPFSHEAVDVFFVLSGFVIAHVANARETDLRTYALARLSRIYSVLLPAVVLTLVLDRIGRSVAPDYYVAAFGYIEGNQLLQALRSLLFLGWTRDIGSNVSAWSVTFEVWYYVLFGIAMFMRGPARAIAFVAAMPLAGPDVLVLSMLWLAGVTAYHVSRWWTPGRVAGSAAAALPLLAWIAYEITAAHTARLTMVSPAWLDRVMLPQDVLIASLFAIHLVGINACAKQLWPVLRPLATPINWMAGATFSLYLYHVPVALCIAAMLRGHQATWAARTCVVGGSFLVILALAQVTERRKRAWHAMFDVILPAGGSASRVKSA